ncbi:MAG TPA: type VI secretion system tube protein TssD [Candidatus Acidoferrum sp.]|nr:type VI secretion system tube protein TssD [Candidatus Acidoferrum sp.]
MILAVVAVIAVAVQAASQAPTVRAATTTQIFMKVVGQKQGVFLGDSMTRAQAGQIVVGTYDFDVTVPFNAATGQSSGRHQYRPITVTKALNGSSPQFLVALATNENLKSVTINFWHVTNQGRSVNFYRVTLTNAHVTEVHQFPSGGETIEAVSFTFQKIEQTDLETHTIFTDEFQVVA